MRYKKSAFPLLITDIRETLFQALRVHYSVPSPQEAYRLRLLLLHLQIRDQNTERESDMSQVTRQEC